MCGLVGYFSPRKNYDLALALESLSSRGPDEVGTWNLGDVFLGHRRLAIIDLGNGQQPMAGEDGQVAIAYNGEIYNFRDLKLQLQEAGAVFRTSCDTEVILQGYLFWGDTVIRKLDGIFAFAIYDHRDKSILLARDRCGIKPLFFQIEDDFFSFGSTLASVCAIRQQPEQLDYQSLYDFLAFQTALSPRSFLKSVQQLEPAHYLRFSIDKNHLDINSYWEIPECSFDGTFAEAVELSDHCIEKSVGQQLVSDVPLGAFLSGGIDSSLMVHYMSKHSVGALETFNVSFDGKGFDETSYALDVSRKYGTKHQILDAPHLTADLFEDSINALDQPLADPAYPMTWFLSRETRKSITVAISGDGGDELFGGYGRFNDLASHHPDNWFKKVLRCLYRQNLMTGKLCSQMFVGMERILYKRVECGNYPGNRKNLSNFLQPDICRNLSGQPILKWSELVLSHGGFDERSAMMKADLWTYLSENCLMKTDRASMAWGLEVRVPFLGNEVLDLGLSFPDSIHFKGKMGKQILRALSREFLPESVWNRKKHGFSVPIRNLFQNEWRPVCEDALLFGRKNIPIFKYSAVETLWRQVLSGKGSCRFMYAIIVFLIWSRLNQSILSIW